MMKKIFCLPLLIGLTGCSMIDANKDYKTVDAKSAAEIQLVAPYTRRSSIEAHICQPGRKGRIHGNGNLLVEPGVPTFLSVSESRRKPGAVISTCRMSTLFEPSSLKKYYVNIHAVENKCYLAIDHKGISLTPLKKDLLDEHLMRKAKDVSCNDVVAGKATANNIDTSIEKSALKKQQKEDDRAAKYVVKKFKLDASTRFVRNTNAYQKVEKDGEVYYVDSFIELFKAPYYISIDQKGNKPMTLEQAEAIAIPYIQSKGCTSSVTRKPELDRHTEDRNAWLIGVEC